MNPNSQAPNISPFDVVHGNAANMKTNVKNTSTVKKRSGLDENIMSYEVRHDIDGQTALQRAIEDKYNGNVSVDFKKISGFKDKNNNEDEIEYFKSGYEAGRKEYALNDSSEEEIYQGEKNASFNINEGKFKKFGIDYIGKSGEDKLRKELGLPKTSKASGASGGAAKSGAKNVSPPKPDYGGGLTAQYDASNGWMLTKDPFGGGSSFLLRTLKSKYIDMSKPVTKFASAYLAALGQLDESELHTLIKVRRISDIDVDLQRNDFEDLINEIYEQDPSLAGEMIRHLGETLKEVNDQELHFSGSDDEVSAMVNTVEQSAKTLFPKKNNKKSEKMIPPKSSVTDTNTQLLRLINDIRNKGHRVAATNIYSGYKKLIEAIENLHAKKKDKTDWRKKYISDESSFVNTLIDKLERDEIKINDKNKLKEVELAEPESDEFNKILNSESEDGDLKVSLDKPAGKWAFLLNRELIDRSGSSSVVSQTEMRKRKIQRIILRLTMNYPNLLKGKVEFLLNEIFKASAENTISLINLYTKQGKSKITLNDIINCSTYPKGKEILPMFVQFMILNKNKPSLFSTTDFKTNKLMSGSSTVGDRMSNGTYSGGGDFNRNTIVQSRATQSNLVSASIENKAMYEFFKNVIKQPGTGRLVYREPKSMLYGAIDMYKDSSRGYFDTRTGSYRLSKEFNSNYSPIFDTSLLNTESNYKAFDNQYAKPVADVREIISRGNNTNNQYRSDVSIYTTPAGASYLVDNAILNDSNSFGAFYERGHLGKYNRGMISKNSDIYYKDMRSSNNDEDNDDEDRHGRGIKRKRGQSLRRYHQNWVKREERLEEMRKKTKILQEQVQSLGY